MRRIWWGWMATALGIALLLALWPAHVWACSCLPPSDPKTEMESATAVFSGRVYSIQAVEGSLWVHLEVSEVWKGPFQSLITVHTADSSAACGYSFIEGENYLVYAYGDLNHLEVSLCSRTRLVNEAAEDFKLLGPGTSVSQLTGGEKAAAFDPDRLLAPLLSLVSGGLLLGILLNGLFDFRPARR